MFGESMGSRLQLDEEKLWAFIHEFHAAARADDKLGPLLAASVSDRHAQLLAMFDLWSYLLLGTARYKRNPVPVHARLTIELAHFDRWLALLKSAADSQLPADAAAKAKLRASRMIPGHAKLMREIA
jgi:hemoglobin